MKYLLALFALMVLVGCNNPLPGTAAIAYTPENQIPPPGQPGWTLSGGAYVENGYLVMPSGSAAGVYNGPFDCPAWNHHTELTFTTTAPVHFQMIGYDAGDTARWHYEDEAYAPSYHYDIQDLTPGVGVVKFRFAMHPGGASATASEFVLVDRPDSLYVPPPPPAPPESLLYYPYFPSPISLAWKAHYTTQSISVDYSMYGLTYSFSTTGPMTVTAIFDNATAGYRVTSSQHSLFIPKPTGAKTMRLKLTSGAGKKDPAITVSASLITSSH